MAIKNYRDEAPASRQKLLLIVFGVLLLIAIIIYFVLGWRPF
jgi:hypothetical protein